MGGAAVRGNVIRLAATAATFLVLPTLLPQVEFTGGPLQLVIIALLFGVSAEYGISRWYAMMEASLARHLSKLGIDFQRIGPPVEHRGKRYPMMARVDELLASIATRNPAFGALIHEVRESVLAQGIAASDVQPSAHPVWSAAGAWQPGGPFVTPPRWREEQRIVGAA